MIDGDHLGHPEDLVEVPNSKLQKPWYAEDQFWAKGGQVKLFYDDPENEENRAEKIIGEVLAELDS